MIILDEYTKTQYAKLFFIIVSVIYYLA